MALFILGKHGIHIQAYIWGKEYPWEGIYVDAIERDMETKRSVELRRL